MPRARYWTDEQDAKLRRLWAEGLHVHDICPQLGRRQTSVYDRARHLNLPQRPQRAVATASCIARARDCAIPWRVNRDREYVAACLAQGGFKTLQIEYRR